jgi:hypothetical protein
VELLFRRQSSQRTNSRISDTTNLAEAPQSRFAIGVDKTVDVGPFVPPYYMWFAPEWFLFLDYPEDVIG